MKRQRLLHEALQRVATGPTMSRDLSRTTMRDTMRVLLDGEADPVQAGILLIALRMKRETDDELAGVLDAVHDGLTPRPLAIERLLTIVDPYDGQLRGTPVTAFLPPLLAAAGHAALTHGVFEMGPKFGATAHRVLAAAGLEVGPGHPVGDELERDDIGWSHADQADLAPELAALAELRTRIVKRPCLTTIEVAVNAFRPRGAHTLVTGYVHKGYPPIYAALGRAGGFDRTLVVRGVEGSVQPSLSQPSRVHVGDANGRIDAVDLEPSVLGIEQADRSPPLPTGLAIEADAAARSIQSPGNAFASELAVHAARIGLAALDGECGAARDALLYSGAVILAHDRRAPSLVAAAERLAACLDDGSARQRFDRLCAARGAAPAGSAPTD